MVSREDERIDAFVQEVAEAIEKVRIKYGAKRCEHGKCEGVALFLFYPNDWTHGTLMGDFSPDRLIDAVAHSLAKKTVGIVIPIG